ncbi:MAG: hypothetical protein WCW47_02010 [Candidatus Paceibacterota bacterium]|jgi:hypothetical protein
MDKLRPSRELREKILFSIKKEEVYRAKMYFFMSITIGLASIFGLFFSVRYMVQEFYQSSFGSFISIIFSDPNMAIYYWKELSLSLLETLPILGITVSLIAMYTLLVSVRTLVKNIRGGLILSFNN